MLRGARPLHISKLKLMMGVPVKASALVHSEASHPLCCDFGKSEL